MRNLENKILLWSNGRNLALVVEWAKRPYDGWNSSPFVGLYEATTEPAVYVRKREVVNQSAVDKAQKAAQLALAVPVPEPIPEDISDYPRYETAEAYQAELAEFLRTRLEYSDFNMKFRVLFEGREGDDETGEEYVQPFPLHASLADGQVAEVLTLRCINVRVTEWFPENPTFNPGYSSVPSREERRRHILNRLAAASAPPEVIAMCEEFAQGVDAYRKGTTDRWKQEKADRDRRVLAAELGIELPGAD